MSVTSMPVPVVTRHKISLKFSYAFTWKYYYLSFEFLSAMIRDNIILRVKFCVV
jgi:hypothetical protein